MAVTVTGYVIPFSPQPQKIVVQLGGTTYTLTTRWLTPSDCWLLDIADVNNNPIVSGIPMITGADLLEQYRYLGFTGSLFAYATQAPVDTVPTFRNLGITTQVAFFPDAAL